MADKNESKAAPGADKPTGRAEAAKASGVIVYNPFLDAWRCVDASGRCVLSVPSKETAVKAYPTFIVKE